LGQNGVFLLEVLNSITLPPPLLPMFSLDRVTVSLTAPLGLNAALSMDERILTAAGRLLVQFLIFNFIIIPILQA
jgi:fumarate reductase subunit D